MTNTLMEQAKKVGDEFKMPDYFLMAEPSMRRQWEYFIWPRIKDLPRGRVLDLACGYGRNTEMLTQCCNRIIAADINEECLNAVGKRMAQGNITSVSLLLLDGFSLTGIEDESISLVYSWDAMVHFEQDIIASYIKEFKRVLCSDGYGFIHHSNFSKPENSDFKETAHWRNYMTKELFASMLADNGFEIVSQDIIDWDESIPEVTILNCFEKIDCITVFKKA